jgi:putative YhdH/YhfP family quinone oxidoreductase
MSESNTFQALVTEKNEQGFKSNIHTRHMDDLPAGDVTVRVSYSSLNYKDALSASGNRGVTKRFPHTPGIDAAGTVVSSKDPTIMPGSRVIVSCYDLGMNTDGGFGEYIRVPAEWVMVCPENLSLFESMVIGTAGFTAALSLFRLQEQNVHPGEGEILVTGATGGVGSMAVTMLARSGFSVVALSGKQDQTDFLLDRGAAKVISRQALPPSSKALLRPKFRGVIDTVGGDILTTAIKSTQYNGVVTCCGNVASADLNLTVYPFILRGVRLIGIDAAECPMETRKKVWDMIAGPWKITDLEAMATTISLNELNHYIERMLQGKLARRTVIKHRHAEE